MDILIAVAKFVRDLLNYDEQLIRFGRENFELTGMEESYIGLDMVSPAVRLGGGQRYDGTQEVMTYSEQWIAPVTLSFYGADAQANMNTFRLLLSSQKALELQGELSIAIFKVTSAIDIKLLTGQQYNNRIDISFNVGYFARADVDTLRIDTAEMTFLVDN